MISLPILRQRIQIDASKEPVLEATLAAALALWDQATGMKWSETPEDGEVYAVRANGEVTLLLPHVHVAEISQVRRRDLFPGATFEIVDEDDYRLDGRRGLQSLAGKWRGLIEATYSGGCPIGSAPADVAQAIITQVQFMLARNRVDSIAVAQVSNSEGGSTSYLAPDLHPLFRATAAAKARR